MARTVSPVTLSVDAVDGDGARQVQIEKIVFNFERYLRKRRGPLTSIRWRRDINKFLTTQGTTYEQIRARLESDLNLELTLTENELREIIR